MPMPHADGKALERDLKRSLHLLLGDESEN